MNDNFYRKIFSINPTISGIIISLPQSRINQWPLATGATPSALDRAVLFNPLVPDAHYSERQDKPFSLQIQWLEVDLKLNCGFLFLLPGH